MIIVEGIDHVSIAVTNLAASAKFYSDLFDFEVLDDSNSKFTIMTLDPIKVKLVQVEKVENQLSGSLTPVLSFVMDVDDLPNEELKTLFRETVKDWESRK